MDQNSVIKAVPALASAAKTAAFTGLTVDAKGYDSCTFVAQTGTVTDGTTTVGAEYSDDNVSWADVPDSEIIGTKPTFGTDAADDNTCKQFGVIVRHRYYRLDAAVAGATTGLVIGAVAVLGHPAKAPTA